MRKLYIVAVWHSLKDMSHSHYVQFAHIPRMKFWYVDIRGYTWENWEELRSLREIITDVSRMNHVKTTEETLKTSNEMRKIHVKNEWIAYKSLMDRVCITNYLSASTHDLRMLGDN